MWRGISYTANRHLEASNPCIKGYNSKKPNKYIMYLDANNLYGWATPQYLPTGGFKWLTANQINKLDIHSLNPEEEKGLILEVDLEYPHELHDLHNDYPLAAEKTKVTKDMLSPYCKQILEKYNVSIGQASKLVPTLANKEKYVLHYCNLQLYLELGLKLKTILRALEFNQSPWLAQYIDYNTKKRMQAKNAFEKDFFQLMNNKKSIKKVFGKRWRISGSAVMCA